MSYMTLKGLRTRRNLWQCDVSLYKERSEAEADGFNLIYEDEEGAVYGIRKNEYCWEKLAFVPYPEYYSKYEGRAIG